MPSDYHRAGLANRLILYFLTLGAGIVLKIVLNDPVNQIIAEAKAQCEVSACTTGIGWAESAWDWLPLWILVGATVLLVAGSIIEARRRP